MIGNIRTELARLVMWLAYWITPPGTMFMLGYRRGTKSVMFRHLPKSREEQSRCR